jgi:hypothetical protein
MNRRTILIDGAHSQPKSRLAGCECLLQTWALDNNGALFLAVLKATNVSLGNSSATNAKAPFTDRPVAAIRESRKAAVARSEPSSQVEADREPPKCRQKTRRFCAPARGAACNLNGLE